MGALGSINASIEARTRSSEFVGACRYLFLTKGRPAEAIAIAQQRGAPRGIIDCLKATVESATSTDSIWAGPLVGYGAAFSQTLPGYSSFDTIWARGGFQRTPIKTKITSRTLAATGTSPGEAKPKAISRFSLSQGTLEPTKSTCTVVVSNEIVNVASDAAFTWLNTRLRDGVAKETDRVFCNAIINNGSIDTVTSSGSDFAAFNYDLTTAMVLLSPSLSATSKPYLLMPPRVMAVAALMRSGGSPAYPQLNVFGIDGSIAGVPVLPCDALTNTIIALDARQVCCDLGPIVPDIAQQAAIQFDDDPSSGEQSVVSLWQNNETALRFERWWAFELLSSDACVKVENIALDQGTAT